MAYKNKIEIPRSILLIEYKFATGLTFQHIRKTLQHIPKTLQHISLFNTFFNQNAKKKTLQHIS
jgi:hypothetical protein